MSEHNDDQATEHYDRLREQIAEAISGARIAPLYPSMEGSHITPAAAADAVIGELGLTLAPDPTGRYTGLFVSGWVPDQRTGTQPG